MKIGKLKIGTANSILQACMQKSSLPVSAGHLGKRLVNNSMTLTEWFPEHIPACSISHEVLRWKKTDASQINCSEPGYHKTSGLGFFSFCFRFVTKSQHNKCLDGLISILWKCFSTDILLYLQMKLMQHTRQGVKKQLPGTYLNILRCRLIEY